MSHTFVHRKYTGDADTQDERSANIKHVLLLAFLLAFARLI